MVRFESYVATAVIIGISQFYAIYLRDLLFFQAAVNHEELRRSHKKNIKRHEALIRTEPWLRTELAEVNNEDYDLVEQLEPNEEEKSNQIGQIKAL